MADVKETFDAAKTLIQQALAKLSEAVDGVGQLAGRESGLVTHIEDLKQQAAKVYTDIQDKKSELGKVQNDINAALAAKEVAVKQLNDAKNVLTSLKNRIP